MNKKDTVFFAAQFWSLVERPFSTPPRNRSSAVQQNGIFKSILKTCDTNLLESVLFSKKCLSSLRKGILTHFMLQEFPWNSSGTAPSKRCSFNKAFNNRAKKLVQFAKLKPPDLIFWFNIGCGRPKQLFDIDLDLQANNKINESCRRT